MHTLTNTHAHTPHAHTHTHTQTHTRTHTHADPTRRLEKFRKKVAPSMAPPMPRRHADAHAYHGGGTDVHGGALFRRVTPPSSSGSGSGSSGAGSRDFSRQVGNCCCRCCVCALSLSPPPLSFSSWFMSLALHGRIPLPPSPPSLPALLQDGEHMELQSVSSRGSSAASTPQRQQYFPVVRQGSAAEEEFGLSGVSAPRVREVERLPVIGGRGARGAAVSFASPPRVAPSSMGGCSAHLSCSVVVSSLSPQQLLLQALPGEGHGVAPESRLLAAASACSAMSCGCHLTSGG